MLKKPLLLAFVLTLVTYAFIYHYQPIRPLDAASTTIVFGIWFGLSSGLLWLKKKFFNRRSGNAS